MAKKLAFLLIVLILTTSACADGSGGTTLTVRTVEYEHTIIAADGAVYEVMYDVERMNLNSMIKDSDLVLVGEVVKQELGDLSVRSEVKILLISRGNYKEDAVEVVHMKTCPIYVGDEYLLALSSRESLSANEYDIMGGHQGIFHQLEEEIEVTDEAFVPLIEKKFGGKDFTIYDLAKWFKRF